MLKRDGGFRSGPQRCLSYVLSRRSSVRTSRRTLHSAVSGPASAVAKNELLHVKLPILYDNLHSQRVALLQRTINGFLPKFKTVPAYTARQNHPLYPGHHLIFFPQTPDTSALLPDGTDTVHYPGEPWSQRLWAGGRLQVPQGKDLLLDGRMRIMVEVIRHVRIVGSKDNEVIFVKIERRLATYVAGRSPKQTVSTMTTMSEDDLTHTLLIETRDLCFKRPPPPGAVLFSSRQLPVLSTSPDYFHTLVPTPALLFRFSALTFNAHAIHIDPDYTRQVYGLPGLLVHGPLTLVLMLEYMRRVLESEALKRGIAIVYKEMKFEEPVLVVTEINYRNLAPLFVNEEMTLCCKKRDDESNATGKLEKWDVWIQTGQGESASLAMRGTVNVEPVRERYSQ